MSGKTFSEDIGELINSGDKFDYQILAKNTFSHKVKIYFNVLCAGMEDWVRSYGQS
jgi:hypothetical protein